MLKYERCQARASVRVLLWRRYLNNGVDSESAPQEARASAGKNEIQPVDENQSHDGPGPSPGPSQPTRGNRPPKEHPEQRKPAADDEADRCHGRERIDGHRQSGIKVEQGKNGACGSARGAWDPGDFAEGARTQVRRDGEPQWSENDDRNRRSGPEHRELALLATRGSKLEAIHSTR